MEVILLHLTTSNSSFFYRKQT